MDVPLISKRTAELANDVAPVPDCSRRKLYSSNSDRLRYSRKVCTMTAVITANCVPYASWRVADKNRGEYALYLTSSKSPSGVMMAEML